MSLIIPHVSSRILKKHTQLNLYTTHCTSSPTVSTSDSTLLMTMYA